MRPHYDYQVTAADWLRAVDHNQQTYTRHLLPPLLRSAHGLAYGVLGALLVVLELRWLQRQGLGAAHWLVWAGPAFVLVAYLLQRALLQWRTRRVLPQLGQAMLGSMQLVPDDDGLWLNSAERRSFYGYRALTALVQVEGASLLYYDALHCIVLPDAAFADATERDAFLATLRERVLAAGGSLVETPSAVSSASGEAPPAQPGLWQLAWRGLTLRALPVSLAEAGWGRLFLLAALLVLLQNGLALLHLGPEAVYSAAAWPATVFALPLLLFVAWLAAGSGGDAKRTLGLATAWYAVLLPLTLLGWVVFLIGQQGWVPAWNDVWDQRIYLVWTGWFALAAGVLAARSAASGGLRRLVPLLLAGGLLWLPMQQSFWGLPLWDRPAEPAPEEQQDDPGPDPAMEDYFYQEPALLQRALLDLKPREPGHPNLYFLAAAGYAGQDVFMREAITVQDMFDHRFGTEGRSLALVNNPDTLGQLPIASATSLRLALRRMGQLMDKNEDILFLYLTSHGSADHKLAVEFGPMQFNDVDPLVLRQLLDEAGIKHRVIVVSACYSGGFIDPLKNDNTLVISAAAADKVSFGCSNEADFTYFGRAYFVDALRQTDDFIAAFDLARSVVAKREQQEGFEASDPQLAVGSRIGATLRRWDAQRKARAITTLPG
ncbi:C13 family peptidase [Chitinimonas sp.]|uniref:C13 family peptidase n=1 Tax=Chitinimonas sp. TaxID=1934313 RepID=UPI002F924986